MPQIREAGYEVGINSDDAPMLKDVGYDVFIDDAEVIEVGRLRLHAIHNPGHTPGSVSFLVEGAPVLFSGDTLFPGGPGATKFAGADFATIIDSIDNKLFTLPANTIVMPGHGVEHHHRQRAAAPAGVGRPWLVSPTVPHCRTTSDPPTTRRSTPSTCRPRPRATATSSPPRGSRRPPSCSHLGDDLPGRPEARVQATHRPLAAVARRAGRAATPGTGWPTPTI